MGSFEDLVRQLGEQPFRDLGFARVDTDREARQGAPEGIMAEGKTPDEIAAIASALLDAGAGSVMVTRADADARAALLEVAPDAETDERARLAWVARSVPEVKGLVTIVSGGTSDGPVVREAQVRAELLGTSVAVHRDAGVAGIHRLTPALEDLRRADCVVVVAGWDAALASVVGGLVAAPVIGVPTSTGYGAAFGGVSALLAMLTSCAAGVAVVNIDDGFGAGTIAARIARKAGGSGGRQPPGVMTRVLYIDCVGGVAGDMLLGALLDAGATVDLGLDGIALEVSRTERHGIGANRVVVTGPPEPPHRDWASIRAEIDAAGLPERPRARAQETFRRLAHAEGKIHGIDPDTVHFHEVGAVDAVGEVIGVALALESLAIDRVVCSPLPIGRGFVEAAHGTLPLPAPATLELLRGAPLHGVEVEFELVTPTGAALVAALADSFGPLPRMTLEGAGYGAGSRDLEKLPNVVRAIVGSDATTGAVSLIEANLDDLVPELAPDAAAACFAAGALDVWTAPVQMKRGRPGFVMSALARPDAERAVAEAMLRETSTLGVRIAHLDRIELERESWTVEVAGEPVRVKVGRLDGRVVNLAPEHADCERAARITGDPVKTVWARALAAAHEVRT